MLWKHLRFHISRLRWEPRFFRQRQTLLFRLARISFNTAIQNLMTNVVLRRPSRKKQGMLPTLKNTIPFKYSTWVIFLSIYFPYEVMFLYLTISSLKTLEVLCRGYVIFSLITVLESCVLLQLQCIFWSILFCFRML